MCEQCTDNNKDMYPDLGKGSMLEIKINKTWVSADHTQGLRIAQTRHVNYMGPEGVVSRDETQCVYIGWSDVEETLTMMLALQMKVKEHNEDSSD